MSDWHPTPRFNVLFGILACIAVTLLAYTTASASPPAAIEADESIGDDVDARGACLTIIENPVDRGILAPGQPCVGQHQATFSVVAFGAGELSYEWYINGVAVVGSAPELTLPNEPILDGAEIFCVISATGCTNSAISGTATLWVGRNSAADIDADCDVDVADFAPFAQCFGGAENPPSKQCPLPGYHDFDNDGDTDLSDFALFVSCFGGANSFLNPACGLW